MKRTERQSVKLSTQQHKHIINRNELVVEFAGETKRVVVKNTQNPIPTGLYWGPPEGNLTGKKFGSFTVIGRYTGNKPATTHKPKWVCLCDCGRYEMRRSRSIRNPENQHDKCHVCRKVGEIKRHKKYLESCQ